jgi:hypothetical protein
MLLAFNSLQPYAPATYTDGSSIDKAFVEQFKSNVVHLAQQDDNRLRMAVRQESVRGATHNIERLQDVAAIQKTQRHAITPILDAPHTRRVLTMDDFHWADAIDEEDKLRLIIAPESEYAKAGAAAMNRQWDDLIIAAFNGDAVDGDGNTIAFNGNATETNQDLAIAAGGTGMTIDKIASAAQILNSYDNSKSDRYMAMSSLEIQDLLNTTEATSSDYNSVQALVKGDIDTFYGFKIIHTERLPVATTVTSCFAWVKDAMCVGVGRDVVTRVDQRPDLSYAWQVYLAFTGGATRVDDRGVVQIDCDHA